jgi:cytochrome c oxidase assembly factor CtaG
METATAAMPMVGHAYLPMMVPPFQDIHGRPHLLSTRQIRPAGPLCPWLCQSTLHPGNADPAISFTVWSIYDRLP